MPSTKRYSFLKQLLHPLLYVASGLYGSGVRFRLWLYRRHLLPTRTLPLKVISIGNLTAGGTGKTPHTALLARYLQKKGIKTAVLSRGYRGTKVKEGAVISDTGSIPGTLEEGWGGALLVGPKTARNTGGGWQGSLSLGIAVFSAMANRMGYPG